MRMRRGVATAVAAVLVGLLLTAPARADAVVPEVFGVGADQLAPGMPFIVPSSPPDADISPLTLGLGMLPFSALQSRISGTAKTSHSRVLDPTEYPFSTHGKVLLGIGGQRGSCSGTVVSTPNQSTIVTAAHCVREGFGHRGRWANRIVFIPAYEHGRRPFGSFVASRLWVPAPYWRTENPNFDVAVVRLRPNRLGRVARVVGARGWMANVARNRAYRVFGYPAAAMRGEVPRFCDARVRGIRRLAAFIPGPAPSRIYCRMARGSSGGGWVFGGEYLNSVIGYSEIGHPNFIYGPYFGRTVQRLIQQVG